MRGAATEVGLRSDNPGRVPGMVIEADRPCPKCGYNVRGLAVGRPCPECGRPIYFGFSAKADHGLADAPYWYIRIQSAALWVIFAGAVSLALLAGLWEWLDTNGLSSAGLTLVGGMWTTGVAIVGLPRPATRVDAVESPRESFVLRFVALGSQSLWLVAAGLSLVTSVPAAYDAAIGAGVIAGLGVVPTMYLLGRQAEYVGDPDRGSRLSWIATVLAILVVLFAAGLRLRVPIPLPLLYAFGQGVPLMVFMILFSVMFGLWHLFQLAVAGTWAIRVAQREDERDDNLRGRLENERQAQAMVVDNEPFGGPVQAPIGSMMHRSATKR